MGLYAECDESVECKAVKKAKKKTVATKAARLPKNPLTPPSFKSITKVAIQGK